MSGLGAKARRRCRASPIVAGACVRASLTAPHTCPVVLRPSLSAVMWFPRSTGQAASAALVGFAAGLACLLAAALFRGGSDAENGAWILLLLGHSFWLQGVVVLLLACVCLGAAVWAGKATAVTERRAELASIAAAYRQERKAKRAAFVDSEDGQAKADAQRVLEVVALTATELAAAIKAGRYSATEVMRIYCQRGVLAAEKLNVTAAEMFSDAMADARAADKHYKRLKKRVSCQPLPGMPEGSGLGRRSGAKADKGCASPLHSPSKHLSLGAG